MKKTLFLLLIFAMFISLLPIGLAHTEQIEPIVKVKLINFLGNKAEITIQPNGDYVTNDANVVLKANNTYLLKQENGKLSLYKDGTLIKSYTTLSAKPIELSSQLSINNRLYLGSFDFIVENNQNVRPINSVYMEDYLKGVVPIEMYPSWNVEALKVQAVAARTYAMSFFNRGTIDDTISYQVYGGYCWTPSTTKAVDDTAGQVLQYNGRLIDAVYSASNGGMTESNSNAWGNAPVPYLTVKQDTYDPKTPWNFSFNKTQIDLTGKDLSKSSEWWTTTKETNATISYNIKMWLNNNGYANKDIKIVSIPDFSLTGTNTSGRVSQGSITVNFLVKDMVDAQGSLIPQQITFSNTSASKIRSIIGNRLMLSYLVNGVTTGTDNTVTVKGQGDGHGVGMSQWGAKYMADAGKTDDGILRFYYTGANIVPMYVASPKVDSPSTITATQEPIIQDQTQATFEPVLDPGLIKSTTGNGVWTVPYGSPGSSYVGSTNNYVGKLIKLIQKTTLNNNVVWYQFSVDNQVIGWLDGRVLSDVKGINDTNQGSIMGATMKNGIWSMPYGVPGAQYLGSTDLYAYRNLTILNTTTYNSTLWDRISIDGKVIGWIDDNALDKSGAAKAENLDVIIGSTYNNGVWSTPYGTLGAQYLGSTNNYMYQTVHVVMSVQKGNVLWYQIQKDGKYLGWIDSGKALTDLTNMQDVNQTAVMGYSGKGDAIWYIPYGEYGAKFVSLVDNYSYQTVQVVKSATKGQTVWNEISIGGKVLGWVDANKIYTDVINVQSLDRTALVGNTDGNAVWTAPYGEHGASYVGPTRNYINKPIQLIRGLDIGGVHWYQFKVDKDVEGWIDARAISGS